MSTFCDKSLLKILPKYIKELATFFVDIRERTLSMQEVAGGGFYKFFKNIS